MSSASCPHASDLPTRIPRPPHPGPPRVMQAENAALRAMINCNVCHQRQKDVVITKCWHMFCQHCIKRNLGEGGPGPRLRGACCQALSCLPPPVGAAEAGGHACLEPSAGPRQALHWSALLTVSLPCVTSPLPQNRGTASARGAASALGRAMCTTSTSLEPRPTARNRLHTRPSRSFSRNRTAFSLPAGI